MKRRDFIRISTVTTAVSGLVLPVTGLNLNKGSQEIPRRTLGKTGARVSILALGGVIGMQLPPSENHDPVAIAETALDMGINYFDTAPSYKDGQSETNYGHVLARRRKEVFLSCKTHDRTYDGTMRLIEQSLKRLQTDHLDLYQIHGITTKDNPEAWDKPDGVLTAMRKLRDQKVTRFLGITSHDNAELLRKAIEMYEFDTVLAAMNPTGNRKPMRELVLPVANKKKMGIIAMKVMGGGNGCLAKGNPYMTKLLAYHDQTANQVTSGDLIRYVLGLPVTVGVIGVDSVEELKANIAVVKAGHFMEEEEQKKLETLMG